MVADLVTPDPEAEPDAEPELSRVTVVVGGLELDVGIPADVPIATVVELVIELGDAQLAVQPERPDAGLHTRQGESTLARLGGEPFDRNRALADFNVCDGEMLVLCDAAMPCAPMLFDDVEVDISASSGERGWLSGAPMAGCFVVGVLASAAAALLVANRGTMMAFGAELALGAVGIVAACIVGRRGAGAAASPWLAMVALPPIFAGSLHIMPGGSPVIALPMAFSVTGFALLVTLLVSGRGRALHTAMIGLSALGGAAAVSVLLWAPTPRAVGAILATASVMVIYLAPRGSILLSQLPVPPVPTAGEPLDDIETQGGTTVEGVDAIGKQVIPTEEGLIERVGPSNQYLTGIVAAGTVAAVAGSYLAVDVSNGFFWQGTLFTVAVATVLCLRGRSHFDLVQSATLIGGGLLTGSVLIAKTAAYVDGWRVDAALALVALMVLIVACGLIAPRLEFSPVMRRQVEMVEFVAIALLFPLCGWIIRLYAFFRELQL